MGKDGEDTVLLAEKKDGTLPSEKIPYPKSVFFIIGNEFCERFSYYGMKAILILFFTKIIRYEDDLATTVYHVFAMGCYFTPIFGAMLADSFLGKFRTIFYVSILYALGNIVLALSAIPRFLPTEIIAMIGLTLIAVGTGGIKPCVSAFGGDQFAPSQERQLQRFFSFFYMSINVGSLFSTVLTPYLREDIWCFKQHSCFSLAFGVPAILMVVSLILFLLGRPLYKIVAPKGNVVIQVLRSIGHAISTRSKKMGANYIVTVFPQDDKDSYMWNSFVMVQPNSLSMLYQIPQYIIITAGEIMFSITGLEFSYSQAPQSMKAVLQAAWLLTVAFGNLIVVIVAQARMFSKQYYEFFMFAGLMIVDMLIFAVMGYFYKYVDRSNGEGELIQTMDKTAAKGVENLAYSDLSTHL